MKKSQQKGLGVYATATIPSNTIITKVHYVREVTAENPLGPDEQELYHHLIYLPNGKIFIVDNPECYINHSCEANAYLYSVYKTYYIISRATIAKGEEITIDYELSAVNGDTWECKCGSKECRGLHKWDFFSLPDEIKLRSLPFMDPWFVQTHEKRIKEFLDSQPGC